MLHFLSVCVCVCIDMVPVPWSLQSRKTATRTVVITNEVVLPVGVRLQASMRRGLYTMNYVAVIQGKGDAEKLRGCYIYLRT